jgi:hypothetical protein
MSTVSPELIAAEALALSGEPVRRLTRKQERYAQKYVEALMYRTSNQATRSRSRSEGIRESSISLDVAPRIQTFSSEKNFGGRARLNGRNAHLVHASRNTWKPEGLSIAARQSGLFSWRKIEQGITSPKCLSTFTEYRNDGLLASCRLRRRHRLRLNASDDSTFGASTSQCLKANDY